MNLNRFDKNSNENNNEDEENVIFNCSLVNLKV